MHHFTPTGLTPVIDSVFPLPEASSAHRRMESNLSVGTVVLNLHALLGHGLKCGAKIEEAIADLLVC
ncbi:zinc-binding dehydrogenase [Cupriavidus sp. D39]|nr:zinc-binding dehydrogenase [Cupriavidus sp. D39]